MKLVKLVKLVNLVSLVKLVNYETIKPVNYKSVALPFILRFGPMMGRLTGPGLRVHGGKDQNGERQNGQLHPERAVS